MDALKTILYFSIFNYPLRKEEIHAYSNHDQEEHTELELNQLVEKNIIEEQDGFYLYQSDGNAIDRRLKGNKSAEKAMIIARQRARKIARFPYVEAVGISGSLSKGFYDESSDIDFFVITRDNRLWICRTLLVLYKKIFLFNSRKYFCVNYFIARGNCEIEERNRFTATELKTLIPMQGSQAFEEFYARNAWVQDYFSKFSAQKQQVQDTHKPVFTKMIESVCNTRLGSAIDHWFKRLTLRRWQAKFDYMNEEDFKVAMKSTRNISKHHPSNFQKKVLNSLNAKMEEAEHKYSFQMQREHV